MLIVIDSTSHAGTQTVQNYRLDGVKTMAPELYMHPSFTITNSNNYPSDTFVAKQKIARVNVATGPAYRIELYATYGALQLLTPTCFPMGVSNYTDSSGHYVATCNLLVQYYDSRNYQAYDPQNKNKPIVGFALDVQYLKNGTPIDPYVTEIPDAITDTFTLQAFDDRVPHQVDYSIYENQSNYGHTYLYLTIDDVVSVTGDDAVINYRWSVAPGLSYVTTMNKKMNMEQIDSNLTLSYVKPDGSGTEVIVPNTLVTIEDTSRGLTSNGQIKLKLGSMSGFGTRSTRLRVTVEWQ